MAVKRKNVSVKSGKVRVARNQQEDRPGLTKVRAFSCQRALSARVDKYCKKHGTTFSSIMVRSLEGFLSRNN